MSIKTYEIPYFAGIDQSVDENRLAPQFSPDTANMDTEGGRLSPGMGYIKYSAAELPGNRSIDLLTSCRNASGEIPVAVTGGRLYALIGGEWVLKYTYETPVSSVYDTAMVRIDMTDWLVIADGKHQMIKFDGENVELFGSEEGCSTAAVSYLTVYRGRLFAAGEAENPDRIYYSCLPGSGRTVEDWGYVEASPSVEGGHAEVGTAGGDPITAIRALSNQLLIFKKNSLYRLIGDRPGNFTIEHIDAAVPTVRHTSIAAQGDVLYFVTRNGLYYYNGVTARPCRDMRSVKNYMGTASTARSRAVILDDKLYFTLKRGFADEMMIYDLAQRRYMRRTGFTISDIAPIDGMLMLINSARCLFAFGCGATYDGEPIDAFWTTPLTDLGDKALIKSPRMLYLRGSGKVKIELELDGVVTEYRIDLSRSNGRVAELPLFGGGRIVRMTIRNVDGGMFELIGGAEMEIGIRRRTE